MTTPHCHTQFKGNFLIGWKLNFQIQDTLSHLAKVKRKYCFIFFTKPALYDLFKNSIIRKLLQWKWRSYSGKLQFYSLKQRLVAQFDFCCCARKLIGKGVPPPLPLDSPLCILCMLWWHNYISSVSFLKQSKGYEQLLAYHTEYASPAKENAQKILGSMQTV